MENNTITEPTTGVALDTKTGFVWRINSMDMWTTNDGVNVPSTAPYTDHTCIDWEQLVTTHPTVRPLVLG